LVDQIPGRKADDDGDPGQRLVWQRGEAYPSEKQTENPQRYQAGEPVKQNSLKGRFKGRVQMAMEEVHFIAVTANASGQKQIIKHADIVQEDIVFRWNGDVDVSEIEVEPEGTDNLGGVVEEKGNEQPRQVRPEEYIDKLLPVNIPENNIQGCPAEKKFQQEFP
jgi:hypothetical protein